MQSKTSKTISVFLSLQVVAVMAFHSCTIQDVTRCLKPMAPYYSSSKSIFPSYDDRTLDDLCNSFLEMEACLAPIKPACTHEEVSVYEGTEKASKFLCRDGLQQYRNHRVCFADNALTEEGHYCNFTYTHEVELAKLKTEPLEERTRKLCKNTGKFMDCVQRAVRRHCGGGAANWVHSVNLKVFTPFMESIGCHDHRTSASHNNVPIAIVLGVALSLFAILLSIIITSIICRRKARQHNSISLNRLNTGTSATAEDKKARAETRSAKRETNIYSTSPKKTCAVNGNVRTANPEDEEFIKDQAGEDDELDEIVLIKSNNMEDTYERIKLAPESPEKICNAEKSNEMTCSNDVRSEEQHHTEKTETEDAPSKIIKDDRAYLKPSSSGPSREESEHLLPACEDWKNDSDLDSEGFPPPPPPICESEDEIQAHDNHRLSMVNPFTNVTAVQASNSVWLPREAVDPEQTEVKQILTPPGGRPQQCSVSDERADRRSGGAKRNSNLYEEEVDRLLEREGVKFAGGKRGKTHVPI